MFHPEPAASPGLTLPNVAQQEHTQELIWIMVVITAWVSSLQEEEEEEADEWVGVRELSTKGGVK